MSDARPSVARASPAGGGVRVTGMDVPVSMLPDPPGQRVCVGGRDRHPAMPAMWGSGVRVGGVPVHDHPRTSHATDVVAVTFVLR